VVKLVEYSNAEAALVAMAVAAMFARIFFIWVGSLWVSLMDQIKSKGLNTIDHPIHEQAPKLKKSSSAKKFPVQASARTALKPRSWESSDDGSLRESA
jgi:hypothetical protein